jgi:FAD/FMN-containing dehydrogenase
VDLVTADGEQLHVDDHTEPELLWGLRGGGGNFGIVTRFTYQLHPVGPLVLAGPIVWPLEQAPAVLRFVRDYAPEAPDELGITLAARLIPPMPFVSPDRYGTPALLLLLVWSGDIASGQQAVEPLRRLGTPLAEVVRPVPYQAIQSMLDGGAPHGLHYYWKSHRIPELSDDVIDEIVGGVGTLPTPLSQLSGWAMGGAAGRVDPGATAVGDRGSGFELNLTAAWRPDDPAGEQHKAWVRERWEALRPHGSGVYANFLSDEGAAGVERAYGDRLTRLTALKDRYDPENFFRLNANIPPSGLRGERR